MSGLVKIVLAYISILFTLGMGALTAYALTRVEYLSQDTDFLVAIVIVDAGASHISERWLDARFGVFGQNDGSGWLDTSFTCGWQFYLVVLQLFLQSL